MCLGLQKKWFIKVMTVIVLVLGAFSTAIAEIEFPGPGPGAGQFRKDGSKLILENAVLLCEWDIYGGRLKSGRLVDKLSGAEIDAGQAECFQLVLDDGRILRASELRILGMPQINNIEPDPKSCRIGERLAGKEILATLISADGNLNIQWRAILRDGSNYIRQEIALAAKKKSIDIKEIVLWDMAAKAQVKGIVDGSPVVSGNMFFAFENPLSKSTSDSNGFKCRLPYATRLVPGEKLVCSSVFGVVPEGQLRRGFLYYVERERVHPYRPFLHYNSWYDIGYGAEIIEPEQFIEVVELFGKEFIKKRRVAMASFVPDDGWDDPASLWLFHESYPDGFTPLRRAVEKYDSALGAWL
ncbi:MAG: alpha-galactosidase, partial [Planctomycetota bacterium]